MGKKSKKRYERRMRAELHGLQELNVKESKRITENLEKLFGRCIELEVIEEIAFQCEYDLAESIQRLSALAPAHSSAIKSIQPPPSLSVSLRTTPNVSRPGTPSISNRSRRPSLDENQNDAELIHKEMEKVNNYLKNSERLVENKEVSDEEVEVDFISYERKLDGLSRRSSEFMLGIRDQKFACGPKILVDKDQISCEMDADLSSSIASELGVDCSDLNSIFDLQTMFPWMSLKDISNAFLLSEKNVMVTMDKLMDDDQVRRSSRDFYSHRIESESSELENDLKKMNQKQNCVTELESATESQAYRRDSIIEDNCKLLMEMFPELSKLYIKELLHLFKNKKDAVVGFIIASQEDLSCPRSATSLAKQGKSTWQNFSKVVNSPWKKPMITSKVSSIHPQSFQQILDEQLAKKMTVNPQFEPCSDSPSLSRIQDKILNRSNNASRSINQYFSAPDLASKLKVDALQKSFPSVSNEDIALVFQESSFNYKKALENLKILFPQHYKRYEVSDFNAAPILRFSTMNCPQLSEKQVQELEQNDRNMGLWKSLHKYRREHVLLPEFQDDFEETPEFTSSQSYHDLREEAQELARKRNELYKRANQAFENGQGAYAHELVQRSKELNSLMREAHQSAMVATFNSLNPEFLNPLWKSIDLHGLHVDEALRVVKMAIHAKKRQGHRVLYIITGAGKHSDHSRARLKPAVENFLRSKGLVHTHKNHGEFKVYL